MMDRPPAFPNGSSIPMRKTSCTDGHNSCAYALVSVSGYEINILPERFEDRALVISTKKAFLFASRLTNRKISTYVLYTI